MKKQFVTYEIALKLKELGFSQSPPRLGGYDKDGILHYRNISSNDITAPLWQQVIDWFREKYNIHIETYNTVNPDGVLRYGYNLYNNSIQNLAKSEHNIDYYFVRKQAILKVINIISLSAEML